MLTNSLANFQAAVGAGRQAEDDVSSVESGEIVGFCEDNSSSRNGGAFMKAGVGVIVEGAVSQPKVAAESQSSPTSKKKWEQDLEDKMEVEEQVIVEGNKAEKKEEEVLKVVKGNPPLVESNQANQKQRAMDDDDDAHKAQNGRTVKKSSSRSPERSRHRKSSKVGEARDTPNDHQIRRHDRERERKRSRSADKLEKEKDRKRRRRSEKEKEREKEREQARDRERNREKDRRDKRREKRKRGGAYGKDNKYYSDEEMEKHQSGNFEWDWNPEKDEEEEEKRIREMRQRRQQVVANPPVSAETTTANFTSANVNSNELNNELNNNSSNESNNASTEQDATNATINGTSSDVKSKQQQQQQQQLINLTEHQQQQEQQQQQQQQQVVDNGNIVDFTAADSTEDGVTSIAESEDQSSQDSPKKRIDIFQNVKEEEEAVQQILNSAEVKTTVKQPKIQKANSLKKDMDNVDDMFSDMFAEDSCNSNSGGKQQNNQPQNDMAMARAQQNRALADAYDDEEGYYRFQVGEILDGRYEVRGETGKGVFSTVLKAIDRQRSFEVHSNSNNDAKQGHRREHREVAIKILRNNDSMRKAGDQERIFLQRLQDRDPDDINLRKLVEKVGGGQGIRITMVREYAAQLLLSLLLLKRCNLVHADIKPDNILVNERRSKVKICDLGSALELEAAQSPHNLTPYLVSRFYRAPEVILGMPCDFAVDMWSLGCVLYELFTGKICFRGRTNNNMLKCMMDVRGPFPKKMLKKAVFANKHFAQDTAGSFIQCDEDPVTRKPVKKLVSNPKAVCSFQELIQKGNNFEDGEKEIVTQFCDLLEKMMHLDPEKRMSPEEAQRHPFVRPIFQRGASTNNNATGVALGKKL